MLQIYILTKIPSLSDPKPFSRPSTLATLYVASPRCPNYICSAGKSYALCVHFPSEPQACVCARSEGEAERERWGLGRTLMPACLQPLLARSIIAAGIDPARAFRRKRERESYTAERREQERASVWVLCTVGAWQGCAIIIDGLVKKV